MTFLKTLTKIIAQLTLATAISCGEAPPNQHEQYRATIHQNNWPKLEVPTSQIQELHECNSYNDSTILINRATDGNIGSVEQIMEDEANNKLSEDIIDFVNETQAVSSGVMPEIYLTRLSTKCFEQGDFHPPAYAIPIGEEQGIFFRPDHFEIDIILHEIGHLQYAGSNNEVISQLNDAESQLKRIPLILKNEGITPALGEIFSNSMQNFLGHASGIKYLKANPEERLQMDRDDFGTGTHRIAQAFLTFEILERGVSYTQLRNEIEGYFDDGTLQDEIQKRLDGHVEALDRPDLHLQILKKIMEGYKGDKLEFFRIISHFPMLDIDLINGDMIRQMSQGIYFGMEDNYCVANIGNNNGVICNETCDEFNANFKSRAEFGLCCLTPELEKIKGTAVMHQYLRTGTNGLVPVEVDGQMYHQVSVVESLNLALVNEDTPCR